MRSKSYHTMLPPKRSDSIWRGDLLLLALAVILSSAPIQTAPAEAKDDCRNFVVQPKTFGRLKLVNVAHNKDKTYGILIEYNGSKEMLSVRKFDAGQTRITNALVLEQLSFGKRQLALFALMRGASMGQAASLGQGKALAWKIGDARFRGASYPVTYGKSGRTIEYDGISHNGACMLRVRYTDDSKAAPEASLKRYKNYVKEAHEIFR